MADDPVDGFRFFDKRDNGHFASTGGAQQRVNFIDLADHICPAFGGAISWLIFNDRGLKGEDEILLIGKIFKKGPGPFSPLFHLRISFLVCATI